MKIVYASRIPPRPLGDWMIGCLDDWMFGWPQGEKIDRPSVFRENWQVRGMQGWWIGGIGRIARIGGDWWENKRVGGLEHAIAGDLEQEAVLWFQNIKKMGLGDSDLGTTERAGATGKGREGVILYLRFLEAKKLFYGAKISKKMVWGIPRCEQLDEPGPRGRVGKGFF